MDTIVNKPVTYQRYKGWILALLCLNILVVSLDNTVLNVALPSIVRQLHASSGQLQWIVDAYAVVYAGLLLASGSFGDKIGRSFTFFGGLALFGLGSFASAFSPSPTTLIVFRAVMGVGGALVMPATLSILTNVFTEEKQRARAIGVWSGTTGIGVALGPLVGGWLLSNFWWGSVFLINVPIVGLALIVGPFLIPNSKDQTAPSPDLPGAGLSIAGLGLLVWAIIQAPTTGWASGEVIGGICVSITLLVVFVLWERKTTHPMLRLEFFADRRFTAANAAMLSVLLGVSGLLFLLTQYLQFGLGYSPFATGLRISPVALALSIFAPLSIILARKIGSKIVVSVGLTACFGGMLFLSITTLSTSFTQVLVALLIIGISMGLVMAPCTESVMGSLPKEKAGIGSATNGTALQVGGALGVALMGSILSMRYRSHMTKLIKGYPIPATIKHAILNSVGGALAVAQHVGGVAGSALAVEARKGFINGMDVALFVGAFFALAGAILALLFLPPWGKQGRPSKTQDDEELQTKASSEISKV
ncbi:MAG: MFS transporter [Actinobacteria bacterium]|nr:MFS transporter [Actinomycetota bacterium]MCL6105037.1 MFS transporter [Actinomycetota bacterium]